MQLNPQILVGPQIQESEAWPIHRQIHRRLTRRAEAPVMWLWLPCTEGNEAQKSKRPCLRTLRKFAIKSALLVPISALTYKLSSIQELWFSVLWPGGEISHFFHLSVTHGISSSCLWSVPLRRCVTVRAAEFPLNSASCDNGIRPPSPRQPLCCVQSR